jgi:hypothetical protein
LYWFRTGLAAVAPADRTVTPPEPEIVTAPADLFKTVIQVPTGNATLAFVGIVMVEAEAFERVTRT